MVFSFSFFALILGGRNAWIDGGKYCEREYGEDDLCIHYSNCMPKGQGGLGKGYPELCRYSGGIPILCCIDKTESSSKEEYEIGYDNQKIFPYGHIPENNYHSSSQTNKKESTTSFYEPGQVWSGNWGSNYQNKPDLHPNYHHWPYEQHVNHKSSSHPPVFGSYNEENPKDTNKNLENLFFHTYDTIRTTPTPPSKPQPSQNGNVSPATTSTETPSQQVTSSINNGQAQDENSERISSNAVGNGTQTLFVSPTLNTTQSVTVEIPLSRPTVENSVSLRRCIEYFTAVPLPKGRHTPVIGGRDARPQEFPHLALLGYGAANDIQWACGGSLISERYVLTAAHCILDRVLGIVQYVRLGELDVSSTTDDAEERDFTVDDRRVHPLYTPGASYHDIALLRLNDTVQTFTRYIRPACLGTSTALDNVTLVTAGWGLTEVGGPSANILQRTNLKSVSNERYGGKERRDSCQGDSGGPLQYTNYDYASGSFLGFVEIAGITSFGRGCGLTAGVYTRVLPYVKWIESIVWP
ncbi:hypothetical protein Trydic_g18740 [Trypoxylus dichotomus]